MSANTRVYVTVIKTHTEVLEISAVSLHDAIRQAESMSGVVAVVRASYEEEDEP